MSSKVNPKEAVVKYLELQNRPYSTNDITQNLKEFGKTAIQKALDDLVEDSRIREKVYGKQKVYSAIQAENPPDMDTEVAMLESQITDLTEKLKLEQSNLKKYEGTLKDLGSQLTAEEARKQRKTLEESVANLTEKLEKLSKSSVQISEKDKEAIYKDNEKYVKEYRKRKRICMDILNSILENYPKPKKVLLEEVGIETDEDVGCKVDCSNV